jgi:hypothetical protein
MTSYNETRARPVFEVDQGLPAGPVKRLPLPGEVDAELRAEEERRMQQFSSSSSSAAPSPSVSSILNPSVQQQLLARGLQLPRPS